MPLLQFKIGVADSLIWEMKGKAVAKREWPSLDIEAEHERKKTRGPTAPIPSTSVRSHDTGHCSQRKGEGAVSQVLYKAHCTACLI